MCVGPTARGNVADGALLLLGANTSTGGGALLERILAQVMGHLGVELSVRSGIVNTCTVD